MFETSVIQARAQAAGGRLSLLTISLMAHSTVVVGIIAFSIATVRFPSGAPKQFELAPAFVAVSVPPPLGNPNGGAKPQTQPAVKPAPAPIPRNEITAPSTVPDTITPVATPSTGNTDSGPSTGTVPGPIGVPWGTKDSIGDLDAPPLTATVAPVQEKIYEAHEVKAPVALFKPAPPYPQILLKTKLRATVVVRCIIDKNGHVRDAQVIVPALPPFNASVIETVQKWRFTPGALGGQAVETYLNLTVNFAVN